MNAVLALAIVLSAFLGATLAGLGFAWRDARRVQRIRGDAATTTVGSLVPVSPELLSDFDGTVAQELAITFVMQSGGYQECGATRGRGTVACIAPAHVPHQAHRGKSADGSRNYWWAA